MKTGTRRFGALALLGVMLLVGCQKSPERIMTLTLSDAAKTRRGEPRDVTLHMVRRGGRWVAGFATARRWNAATHVADLSKLTWKPDANTLSGTARVTLLPDAWVPNDHQTRSLVVTIDAQVDGNAVDGRYTGRFSEENTAGSVKGAIRGASPSIRGERAGLLRVFLPKPQGGLTETVMRFFEEDGRVAWIGGTTASASNMNIRIDSDGLEGMCDLSYGDEDGPFSKPITAEFDLSFIDGRIGGAVFLKGHGGRKTPRKYAAKCSVSGWLEAESDTHLSNRSEPVRAHADTRVLRIDTARQAVEGLQKQFSAHVHEADGVRQPYRLFSPKAAGDKKLPLVVYLHGAGERGSDNKRQLNSWGKIFAREEVQKEHPCFVLAPHASNWYGGTPKGAPEGSPTHAELILQIVRKLRGDPRIDPERIYVTGLSMGGFGTCELIARAPELFAAGVPICGAPADKADAIAGTPMWIFHGDSDVTVHVSHSRDLVKALRARGADPLYTEYPGVGHGSYKWAYTFPAMYDWLFSQRRGSDG